MVVRSTFTLTPELSRMARQELGGMSQVAVSKASGVQSYIIKQWETGKFRPPAAALEKLRQYYEDEGVDFSELMQHAAGVAEPQQRARAVPSRLPSGLTQTPRPGFFIAAELPSQVVEALMQKMGENDDRIASLVTESFKESVFGGMSGQTESKVQELFAALAESHLLFRLLQGRNIIAATGEQITDPKTIGDYLAQWVREQSSAASMLAPPAESAPRLNTPPVLLTHSADDTYTIDAEA